MALLFLTLFVLVQSPRISALGLLKNEKACGTYHISHLGNPTHAIFYVNGKLVNRYVFCESLKNYDKRHCFVKENVKKKYCRSEATLGKLPLLAGRKSLKTVIRGVSSSGNVNNYCTIIAVDSVSSLEMNHVFEKFPGSPMRSQGSPMRVPGSPMRVPGSPRVPPSPSRFSMSPKLTRLGSLHLNMSQVARATNNFSPSLLIGEGGFGTVYRAELPDGQVVAIKRARKEHFEALRTEFRTEVELLAKIDHRNLVKLLGYVEKGNERLIITEYVPNGTLREHLDGVRGKILDFNQRLEISIDVAHGLTYLHLYAEKQIIHRDVKSSNILLTESFRAKVADFGFARLGDESEKTHILTKVKGTVGYLDPEYMRTYQLTNKSDVYSFGILLLEILSGRRPVDLKGSPDERVTIRWAFRKYNEGKYLEMVDPLMNERIDKEILVKMFGLAIQCAAPTRADRPDMKAVGEQLWGIRMDYLRSERRN
ncbi:hypothetical protein RD792_012868 [Penstemon davidsonii]|uniref:Protein kinase domain-containing protein n=1 Tax=Penstemon davidsonii TaxID=160366 RepID=A0ABR0CYF9_9LAMI|nr:hypothetical protein RD792_012868 [Penstemon davidsonii]